MLRIHDDAGPSKPGEQEARAPEQGLRLAQRHPAAMQSTIMDRPAPGFFMPNSEVSRVGMRMPEFTPTDPELWFSIVDGSFQTAGITVDATKFG